MPQQPKNVFVLYASQTGQAETISEFIFNKLIVPGTPSDSSQPVDLVKRYCLSDYDKLDEHLWTPDEQSKTNKLFYVVFVVSTTGEGDAPDKATKFSRWLRRLAKKADKQALEHVQFALLGLGDTNYDRFANFGKMLDKLLLELGARKMMVSGRFLDMV